ncbi:MAG: DUF421 domain-containing protein [Candidatus Syntrophopropionicum ammoniitolerans]
MVKHISSFCRFIYTHPATGASDREKANIPVNFFDLVTAIVIGVIAAAISLNLVIPTNGLIALVVWAGFPALIFLLALRYKAVRDIVQGKETVLINHGKVLEDKLLEARLTPEDLLSQLRKKDVFNFADVEFAVLEPTGEVTTLIKKDKQAVTPKTLGFDVARESVPQTVMLDGIIMDEPLTAMGLNRRYFHTELEKVGVYGKRFYRPGRLNESALSGFI